MNPKLIKLDLKLPMLKSQEEISTQCAAFGLTYVRHTAGDDWIVVETAEDMNEVKRAEIVAALNTLALSRLVVLGTIPDGASFNVVK